MKAAIPNLACLAGAGLVLFGAWLAWAPLAPIIGGMLVVAFGMFLHQQRRPRPKPKRDEYPGR
jgi:hypothetical protein